MCYPTSVLINECEELVDISAPSVTSFHLHKYMEANMGQSERPQTNDEICWADQPAGSISKGLPADRFRKSSTPTRAQSNCPPFEFAYNCAKHHLWMIDSEK